MNLGSSLPHIPEELLAVIITHNLDESPRKSDIQFLLLSRGIYQYPRTKFYYSLQFRNPDDGDRIEKLLSLTPSTLQLIRMLKIEGWHDHPTIFFAPFSSLTHLALCGSHGVRYPEAQDIPTLPLEELVVRCAVRELLDSLTDECTLSRTLKRFGVYAIWYSDYFEGLQACRNLTHLFVLYWRDLDEDPIQAFLRREGLRCFIVTPRFQMDLNSEFHSLQRAFQVYSDPRIVLVKGVTECDKVCQFWEHQSALWNLAETEIALNSGAKTVTIIDYFWSYRLNLAM
ncbi:hypothetical protein DL96DRAFT_1716774 [Flagelloscypha sp. PMI_526]|nr:hypothetical protein DL96DRAFT_1716774 [Flagelloscypha sp. PMI_526]